jgi:hypothetical protein
VNEESMKKNVEDESGMKKRRERKGDKGKWEKKERRYEKRKRK